MLASSSRPLTWRVLLLVGTLALAATPAAGQAWVPRAPMPGGPRADLAAVALDGKVYVLGGRDATGRPLARAERYDPATDTWEALEEMRDHRAGAAAAVLGGRLVVMGGREEDGGVTDDVEVWDAERQRWESYPHLARARAGHGTAVLSGQLYAVGGVLESGALTASVEAFYGSGWDDFPDWDLEVPRAQFTCTVAPNGGGGEAAYAIGGFSQFGPLGMVQRYGPNIPTESLEPLEPARGAHAAAVLGPSVYVFGGRSAQDQALTDVQALDVGSGTWRPATALPAAREGAAAAAVNGTLLLFGGRDAFGAPQASAWALEPTVAQEAAPGAAALALAPPFPNPAPGVVTLAFSLPRPGSIRLDVLDVHGRTVASVLDEVRPAGPGAATWDTGAAGLAPGLYLVRLRGADLAPVVRRLTVLR